MEAPNTLAIVLMVLLTGLLLASIVLLAFLICRYEKVDGQMCHKLKCSRNAAKGPSEQNKYAKGVESVIFVENARSVSSKMEKPGPSNKSSPKCREPVSKSPQLDYPVKKYRSRKTLDLKPKTFSQILVCRDSGGQWVAGRRADNASSEFSFEILSGNSGEDTFPASVIDLQCSFGALSGSAGREDTFPASIFEKV